ncbi:MAG: PD-(D/E)XK nuclease family protein [Thermoplasmata archaeon]|nr:PD-(D/E)XK nuclease family protein [Thermoplasmata archaeon]
MAAVALLSYSSVRAYLECPLRWKFLYVDKLQETPRGYFSFGRTVHSVLEELVRPLVIPSARRTASGATQRTLDAFASAGSAPVAPGRLMTEPEMLAAYERLWVGDGYTSTEEEARYRALGRDLLVRYHGELTAERPLPVAVEEHLETRWDGVPIHGYIDRIDRTPTGGLEILDYKTSRELSGEDARQSDQLSMYQVLVERNYAEPVESLTLYHLRSLTPLRVPKRGPAELESLFGRVGTVSDGIRSQAYEPTPGRQCSRCEFKSRCPEFRDVPDTEQGRLSALVDRFAQLREQEVALDQQLRATADELHQEAERLGVHRVPGSKDVAIRRREEAWRFPLDAVGPILAAHGYESPTTPLDDAAIRRMVRDPTVGGELRRKLAETGGRQVRWYWVLEDSNGKA